MDRKVTVAKSAGFCFGVERAVDQVYEQIEALKNKKASGPIYTYIILPRRNRQLLGSLTQN